MSLIHLNPLLDWLFQNQQDIPQKLRNEDVQYLYESLKNLDKTTQGLLLPTYPSIPWKNVKGLRDIIAHHYFDVDASQILWIIKNEISPLKDAIRFFIMNLNDSEQVEK